MRKAPYIVIGSLFLGMCSLVPYAVAEMAGPSTTTDVFSQMGWIQLGVQNTLRGFDRGDVGVRAGGAVSWGDPYAGSTNVILSSEVRTAAASRSEVSDLLRGGMAVLYRINDKGAAIWAAGDGFFLPSAEKRAATFELAAGAKFPVPFWFPENHPMVFLETRQDVSRYQTTYVRAAIRPLDINVSVQDSLILDIGHAWSGLPAGNAVRSRVFDSQGTDITLSLSHQSDPKNTVTGRFQPSVEPYFRVLWNRGNETNLIDGGIRVVYSK